MDWFVPMLAGLFKSFLGFWTDRARRDREARKQLYENVVAPTHSDFAHVEYTVRTRKTLQVAITNNWRRDRDEELEGVLAYDNAKYRDELIPVYLGIAQRMRTFSHLLPQNLSRFTPTLAEYVELLRRDQHDALPHEAHHRFAVLEPVLLKFIDEIADVRARLRREFVPV